MLLLAALCLSIGSFIDTKNLKLFVVILILAIAALKIMTFDFFGIEIKILNRLRVLVMILRMALYFVFQVTLFNWFSRRSLLIMNALLDLGNLIPLIIARIFYYQVDMGEPRGIAVLVTTFLLLCSTIVVLKYFTIDPID